MFCSATPTLKNRAGCRAAKSMVRLAWARSAVSTTMRRSRSARSASSCPATNAGTEVTAMPLPDLGSLSTDPSSTPRNSPLSSRPAAPARSAIAVPGGRRLEPCPDLRDHLVVVGAGQPADVPSGIKFHAPYPAALDGVGDDHLRRPVPGWLQVAVRVEDGVEVVAVDPLHAPPEAAELGGQRLDPHEVLGRPVDGQAVAVHDAHQRGQPILAGGHRRLPHLALGQLAVTGDAERPVVPA